jgi:hypothetical protein
MQTMPDYHLDALFRAALEDQAEALASTAASESQMLERVGQLLARRRKRRQLVTLLLAAALTTLTAAAIALGGGRPTPPATPERSPGISATPEPSTPSPATWSGRVRADADTMPVLPMPVDVEVGGRAWADGRDAALPWVDIGAVRWSPAGQVHWSIELAGFPPRAEDLDPDQTIIEYGVVLDTNRDRVPDYEFGINNDATEAGDFRVWVTNLATGDTDEQIGGPYGVPVEFRHPDEQDPTEGTNGQPSAPSMMFTFLGGTGPSGGPGELLRRDQWQFYTWATVTEGGEVVAWDYGPDSGWLTVPSQ